MRTIGKILAGIISILLFIILLLLVTIKFELLNKSFIFGAFEKNNAYAQLPVLIAGSLSSDPNLSEGEKIGYAEFVKNIQPQDIKPLVENNLTQVLDFLNGQSKDVTIFFSLRGIGFENASGLSWSLSQLPDKNLQERIKALNGIDNILIAIAIIVLIVLTGLFFLLGKRILLIGGIFIIVASLISRLILIIKSQELMSSPELSQKLIGLLFSSLSPEITTAWFIIGGSLISIWIALSVGAMLHEKFLAKSTSNDDHSN